MKTFSETLIQSLPYGLLILDAEGFIQFINQAGERILRVEGTEITGIHLDTLLLSHEGQSLLSIPKVRDSLEFDHEAVVLVSNAWEFPIGYKIIEQHSRQGRLANIYIHFRDLTQERKLADEILQIDRIASLSKFFIGIAHEIRNPLAGIKTTAQALEEEIQENDPHREYLGRIIKEIDRLNQLLKAFLSYAKPRNPVMQSCRIEDIMTEVLFILKMRLQKADIAVVEDYAPDLLSIKADFNQIKQVFLNLIINSIEAMPEGGALSIRARNVNQGRQVQIKVADNGSGISPKHLPRIFDPFFTTRAKGTGMGLSISYRIIQEHQGSITATSKVNEGAEFVILLPVVTS